MKKQWKRRIKYTMTFLLLSTSTIFAISNCILWFVLPRGMGLHGEDAYNKCHMYGHGLTGNYWDVFGWPRYMWVEIHSWCSVTLTILILLHLLLHWRWIIETTKKVKSYIASPVKKVTEQYIAFLTLFILFLFNCFSGFVIWLILPRGALDYNNMIDSLGRTFWGLQRNVWVDIHAWVAIMALAIIIIHLILNWRWIYTTIKLIFSALLHFSKCNKARGILKRLRI